MTASSSEIDSAVPARFGDRRQAGKLLGERLQHLRDEDPLVLALPRGGVPVAAEVAAALDAHLDVLDVRKLGAPGNPEFAIGAIVEDGTAVVDWATAERIGAGRDRVEQEVDRETAELRRRTALYRGSRGAPDLAGRTVVLVDDGVATGLTVTAALRAVRHADPRRVVLAVPVCAPSVLARLEELADEVVCLRSPPMMRAVSLWYDDFGQVSDDEVVALLREGAGDGSETSISVLIPADGYELPGELALPSRAQGLVLFAHGSGSSRLSPRNAAVAGRLREAGLGTLLFDLLTSEEARDRRNVFDIELLARRLVTATRWARAEAGLRELPFGYFGASTGAAAALIAAAEVPRDVAAVVSRGGRPDLAMARLPEVVAPTLLIVGGADREVLALNSQALKELRAPSELKVVEGATHLFEEPGALERVADLASEWFKKRL